MKNTRALPVLLLAVACCGRAFAQSYEIKGPISGYVTERAGTCHIAVTAPSDSYYSDGYHYVGDAQMCNVARLIYKFSGEEVLVSATVAPGNDRPNDIEGLAVTRGDDPYWPPYRGGNVADHYGMAGTVNGYALVSNSKSCFVALNSSAPQANGYHEVKDRGKCMALLGAYLEGKQTISVQADRGKRMNRITAVNLNPSGEPRWYDDLR